MSHRSSLRAQAAARAAYAPLFFALGDATRLQLLSKLSQGKRCSIATLSEDSKLTRQAITKHLRLLAEVGLVQAERIGRETQFEFKPQPMHDAKNYLAQISKQWDGVLGRLKNFVESDAAPSR